jgi:ABC-type uncharacterized transport system permease subunit
VTSEVADPVEAAAIAPAADPGFLQRYGGTVEYILIPGVALIAALAVFGVFVALFGKSPLDLYFYMYQGAFGTWFSWQNTLTRAAPLILTALCTALPAQLGMVIIGGEGALLIGALAATSAALMLQSAPPLAVQLAMVCAGMIGGGLWIMLAGGLRQYRGVNETISSLLLVYIALAILNHLVEGMMRDPASLNKPSTREIGAANMIGSIHGTDVHWGLVFGMVAAVASYILIYHTVFGFAARVAGGNIRAAKPASLAWSRSPRCRAAPTPTSPQAMVLPASLSPSWHGRIHWRSFRSRSCSAGSAPAAGCCSAGSACPMHPFRCCRESSSSPC